MLGYRPVLVVLVLAAFAACRKDEAVPEPSPSGSAPFRIDVPQWALDVFGPVPLPPDVPFTPAMVQLGRKLFHEKALSDDYTLDCASCHRQEHAFSDPEATSSGVDGLHGTRNSMSIANLGYDMHFFWDGRRYDLEGQALEPVVNPVEMRNTWPVVEQRLRDDPAYPELFAAAFGDAWIDSVRIVAAIAQFERTLVSFDTRADRFIYLGDTNALNDQEEAGLDIFMRDGHCVDCHMGPRFTDGMLRNNGLDMVPQDQGLGGVDSDPDHIGVFKVPTLRNIAVTAPYMHDSRFTTLEEVVAFYADNVQTEAPTLDPHMDPWRFGQVNLDEQEQADLVAFLHTLTDHAFLTNPAFGRPE
jgi:cytochrome c peroxidase